MVQPLRKWHIRLWAMLAVAIPVGFIAAVMVRPQKATNTLLQISSYRALPLVLKTISKPWYTASLRATTDTSQLQLQLVVNTVVTSPTLLVYQIALPGKAANESDTLLVGRVEPTGTYQFPLAKVGTGKVNIQLYDIIHHALIDTISFK